MASDGEVAVLVVALKYLAGVRVPFEKEAAVVWIAPDVVAKKFEVLPPWHDLGESGLGVFVVLEDVALNEPVWHRCHGLASGVEERWDFDAVFYSVSVLHCSWIQEILIFASQRNLGPTNQVTRL